MFVVFFKDLETGNNFSYHSYASTVEEAIENCKSWIPISNVVAPNNIFITSVQEYVK